MVAEISASPRRGHARRGVPTRVDTVRLLPSWALGSSTMVAKRAALRPPFRWDRGAILLAQVHCTVAALERGAGAADQAIAGGVAVPVAIVAVLTTIIPRLPEPTGPRIVGIGIGGAERRGGDGTGGSDGGAGDACGSADGASGDIRRPEAGAAAIPGVVP